MGYHVTYNMRLVIQAAHCQQALEILRDLHSTEGLKGNAKLSWGPRLPRTKEEISNWEQASSCLHYAWVSNPKEERGWRTLEEAIEAWGLVDQSAAYTSSGDWVLEGSYFNKIGD